RNVRVNFHNVNLSLLEGLISKGNRKISKVIYDAWKNGAYLDSWNEYFRLDAWEKAISDNNIDLNFYLHREIPLDEILPWMHLSSGVSDEFLRSEWQKSKKGELTPYCTLEGCNGCGVDAKICFRRKQA
ncbi:MAG TPA: B12-binding domain-containing radical SAM protein, partial [Planctomycetota bacterium]|nr:B12-binding domain-containing radical SAM protein [Planctomycetota bacterium]